MILGLTGGIGTGKTFVANIFEHLDIPVYYSDKRAKELMLEEKIKNEIIFLLGENAYFRNGQLNKKYISQRIFSDNIIKNKLEKIVHSAVKEDFEHWKNENKECSLLVKESALLIESGTYKDVDFVILVIAPKKVRVKRIKKRGNMTEEEIQKIIENQLPDSEKKKYANFVIDNSGTQFVLPQIFQILKKINYNGI